MRVLYQASLEAPLEPYRCRISGRCEFDLTEGAYKARWLVRACAVRAVVLEGETVKAEWCRQGTEIIKVSGPDL